MFVCFCYCYSESSGNVEPSQTMCFESNGTTLEPTTTTDCPYCSSRYGQAVVVGGALGGATVLTFVAIAIISVCIVVFLVKQRRKQTRFHSTISELTEGVLIQGRNWEI